MEEHELKRGKTPQKALQRMVLIDEESLDQVTKTNADRVREFHDTFDRHPTPARPTLPDPALFALRKRLIQEEFDEICDAYEAGDLVEFADGVADLLYVVYGLGIVAGLPTDRLFAEVHGSNMSKLGEDGKPIYREDGKVLKGPNFFKPDIVAVLNEAGMRNNIVRKDK